MTDIIFTPAADDDPSFTPTTTTNHNTLPGRSTADAHPASAITTDNDWNGNLTAAGTNLAAVLDVIDDLALGGGGGAVDSVNGETGTVVLDAADVDAVPITAVGLLAGETNRGDWSGATAYVVGDVVHDHGGDGLVYLCTAATTNEQPSATPAKWTAIDGTGREFAVGAGSHAGDSALSIGPGATSDGGGLSVGPYAASGVYGLSVGVYAVSGAAGLSVGTQATSGVGGLSVGSGVTTGDYEVSIAGIYKGTVDSSDPTIPTGASIATGFVDLPETADVTNPAVGSQRLVARTDGLYVRDEAGAEVGPIGAGGSGIPATIIDAAGDLIIGTAADTAARLAVGTSGQVLTSNGTTAAWAAAPAHASSHQDGGGDELALDGSQITTGTVGTARLGSGTASSATFLRGDQTWGRPGLILPAQSGQYHGLQTRAANATYHFMITITGRMALVPVFVEPGSYDALALNQTVVGTSTWRFGLYPSDPTTLLPDGLALIADLGTLNMSTTTGYRTVAASVSPTVPTLYWAGVLLDALTTAPTVHCVGGGGGAFLVDPPWTPNTMGSNITRNNITRIATGVTTGAMPATCPATSWSDFGPWLALRGA